MESSPLIREAEECSSCESGWTMYLASPMHDGGDSDIEVISNDEEEDHDNDRKRNKSNGGNEDDDEDSDSMASDASTGPIQHRHGGTKCDQSSVMGLPNDDDDDDDDDELENDERNQHSSYSCNKVCGVNKMRKGGRIGVSHREDGATLFHTSSKVRKTSEK